MIILLFGVSNVGKSTVGKEEFVKRGTIQERDKKRGDIIRCLVEDKADKVIAITPMSCIYSSC